MDLEKIGEKAKNILSEEKSGALWVSMVEINDLINYSEMARKYFGKRADWMLQRLHGYNVNGKPACFKPEEYVIFVNALRDFANKLLKAAERIESAK